MTDQKATVMELKVDLQCPCCYKKIKKILCKIPQIRDQKYDEKQNTVTITVVSGSPEKIRDKLRCKGGKIIKSMEIKPPPKPKVTEKKPNPPDKPKEEGKPKKPAGKPPPPPKPCCKPVPCTPPKPWCTPPVCCPPCSKCCTGGPCSKDYCRPKCCGRCSQCVPGPYYPGPPVPRYDKCGCGPYCVCGGRSGSVYYSGPYDYLWEENPSGCGIM